MPRLYRPHIPLKVRVQVAKRQLHEAKRPDLWQNYCAVAIGESASTKVQLLKAYLADVFACEASDLRLDHDPALGARPKRGAGKATRYTPDANDAAHLFYRPHGPQFDGSHLIKTNVRGDHGQHPDRVLIKKQRRLERGPKPKRGPKIQSRGFSSKTEAKLRSPKQKWAKRPFRRTS